MFNRRWLIYKGLLLVRKSSGNPEYFGAQRRYAVNWPWGLCFMNTL